MTIINWYIQHLYINLWQKIFPKKLLGEMVILGLIMPTFLLFVILLIIDDFPDPLLPITPTILLVFNTSSIRIIHLLYLLYCHAHYELNHTLLVYLIFLVPKDY